MRKLRRVLIFVFQVGVAFISPFTWKKGCSVKDSWVNEATLFFLVSLLTFSGVDTEMTSSHIIAIDEQKAHEKAVMWLSV